MKKIKIKSWKSTVPDKGGETREVDESLLNALNMLIANKRPEEIPKGIDKFRLFHRLSKAFIKAEQTKVLELEEHDYSFLKETIEKDVPSVWGMSPNINEAIEEFMNAKTV